jgi:hypothetical protein
MPMPRKMSGMAMSTRPASDRAGSGADADRSAQDVALILGSSTDGLRRPSVPRRLPGCPTPVPPPHGPRRVP